MRLDHRERGAVHRVGGHDAPTPVGHQRAVLGRAGQQVHADEIGDVAGAGLGGHVGQRALLGDAARLEDDDTIGEGIGIDRIVGHQEADARERGQLLAQVAPHRPARAGVERGQRLVEQQQPGLGRHGAGQRDPLGLPARQRRWAVTGVVGQPDAFEPLTGAPPRLGLGHTAGPQPEGHVLDRGEVGEKQVVLEHHAHRPPIGRHEHVAVARRGAGRVERDVVETHVAGVEGAQPGQAPQHRALARAVRAQQRHDVAGLGVELDVERERAEGDDHVGVQAHGAAARPVRR